jgi:phosphate transport system permease protein
MSAEATSPQSASVGHLPEGAEVQQNINQRQRTGRIWRGVFFFSIVFSLLALLTLLLDISNEAFGLIATETAVSEEEITGGRELDELSEAELIAIINENLSGRVLTRLNREEPLEERNQASLIDIVETEVLQIRLVGSWPFWDSLTRYNAIAAELAERNPRAELRWNSWISWDFLTTPMSSVALNAGVRTAILGSLWVTALTALFAIPIGVGAAIYLEEYSTQTSWFSRLIQTNISNLAGVPSIIYGMLGLAIFVRTLEYLTSGAFFGASDATTANGRTIISASMTMALLILPIIIIAAQEAIRAVPNSLRQGSYGLGATKWQTVKNIVLPQAFPGILTGIILAVSRAAGETAPLILVGASTFIVSDPNGPFSKFTVVPIQIYNWTSRPEAEFKAVAAAAIIVLLVLILMFNATAVLLRNYFRSKRVSV